MYLTANLYFHLKREMSNFMLTHSLREPGQACTKSMEDSESRMERVKGVINLLLVHGIEVHCSFLLIKLL